MKNRIKYKVLRIPVILGAIIFMAVSCNQTSPIPTEPLTYKSGTLAIGSHVVNVEIADTEALRNHGLSGRDSLAADHGMIFIFPTPDKYAFWMKDMSFSLDFIWIKDGKVSEITPDVPIQANAADRDLNTYLPVNPIDSMLEVNAGWAQTHDIKVGDAVVDHF